MKTIKDIRDAFNNGGYSPNKFEYKLTKLADTHVFDMDKSVRWNIEQVKAWNQQVDIDNKRLKDDTAKLDAKLHSDVAEYIMHEYGFNIKQAKAIEGRVYYDKHACMSDYFDSIDDIADTVKQILDLA